MAPANLNNRLKAESEMGKVEGVADGLTRLDLVAADELGYLAAA